MKRWIRVSGNKANFLHIFLVFMVCFLLLSAPKNDLRADDKPVTKLDEMVATGDRTAGEVLYAPYNITILTGEDIRQSGQMNLAGVVSAVPGVFDDSSGTRTYFNFRGTRSSMSAGPLVYLNGIAMNQGKSGYSLIDNIPLESIERIEVIKSPPSSLYGANAARGIINIITKTGGKTEKPFAGSAGMEVGSWKTFNLNSSFYGKTGDVDYYLSAVSQSTDAHRDTGEKMKAFDATMGYQVFDGMKLSLTGNYSDSSRAYGPRLERWALDQYRDRPDPPNRETDPSYRLRPNETDIEVYGTGLNGVWDLPGWQMKTAFSYRRSDEIYTRMRDYNDPERRENVYREGRGEDNYRLKLSGSKSLAGDDARVMNNITAGYEYDGSFFTQRRKYPYAETLSDAQKNRILGNTLDYKRAIQSLFLTNELIYGSCDLTAGLRYGRVDYDLESKEPMSFSADFEKVAWNVSPAVHFTQNSTVYFSAGKSYWYPVSSYFAYAIRYDDPENRPEDLVPEEYTHYEVGYKHRFHRNFNLSAALFRTAVKGKYIAFYVGEGSFKGYKPLGTSIHQGVEIEADGRPAAWLGYVFGFSYVDAHWDRAATRAEDPEDNELSVMDISGKTVVRVPEYELLARMMFYPARNVSLSGEVRGVGAYYIDPLNRWKRDAVYTFNANLKYKRQMFGKTADFHLAGVNLLNKQYESVFNSSGATKPDGTPDNTYHPIAGRYLEAGLTVHF